MSRHGARLLLAGVAATLIVSSGRGVAVARQPTLQDILAKAAQYVTAFTDPSRALVCEEAYEHTYFRRMTNAPGRSERLPQNTRRWVAEKVVLATPADEKAGFPWTEFRDLVSLDKKPARDGVSRLSKLLIEPRFPDITQATAITRETTGTQAGRMDRMVLLPRLPAVFLHAVNQPRFTFTKGGGRTVQGVKTIEVKFQEKGGPTIVKSTLGREAKSSGSFWIDPATGAVCASLYKNGDSSAVYDELTTSYALDQATSLWLPVSLIERMYDSEDDKEIDGRGTFKNWRFAPRGK